MFASITKAIRNQLLKGLVWVYISSVRVQFEEEEILGKEKIIALWHRDLPASIKAFSHKNITVQISASNDGEIAADICRKSGYHVVRGSSSSLQGSIRSLLRALKYNRDVGVTLDGPGGPAGVIKPGVWWLSKKSKKPVVIVVVKYSHAITLNTWDKMKLPLPFSTVQVSLKSISANEKPDENY